MVRVLSLLQGDNGDATIEALTGMGKEHFHQWKGNSFEMLSTEA